MNFCFHVQVLKPNLYSRKIDSNSDIIQSGEQSEEEKKPSIKLDTSIRIKKKKWEWESVSELEQKLFIVLFNSSRPPVFQVKLSFLATQVSSHRSRWSFPQTCNSGKFLNDSPFESLFIIFLVEIKEFQKTSASLLTLQMDELPIRKLLPPSSNQTTKDVLTLMQRLLNLVSSICFAETKN